MNPSVRPARPARPGGPVAAPERTFFALGCLFAFLAVGAGAFAAHGLQGHVSSKMIGVWNTAAEFQMYHALALLATAWAVTRWPSRQTRAAGWLFAIGIVLFSGSLYALVGTGARWIGAVTPLGGLALLAGWVVLGLAAWRGARDRA